MDANSIETIMATVESIAMKLDMAHDSWGDHLQAVRQITAVLEFSDKSPAPFHKEWQIRILVVFQRVAYADADSGGIPDIGDWCLKQAVTLLQVYPEDIELLTCKKTDNDPYQALTLSSDRSELAITSTEVSCKDSSFRTGFDQQC